MLLSTKNIFLEMIFRNIYTPFGCRFPTFT